MFNLSLPHYVSFIRAESCHFVHCCNLAPGRVPGTQWALDTYLVNKGLSVDSRLRIVFLCVFFFFLALIISYYVKGDFIGESGNNTF